MSEPGFTEFSTLEFIKTDAELAAYVAEHVDQALEALADAVDKSALRHTKTRCPECGLMCGYWITYYSRAAKDLRTERDTLAARVHNQRAEIVRLESARTPASK